MTVRTNQNQQGTGRRQTTRRVNVTIGRRCMICKHLHLVTVTAAALVQWEDGASIQDCMPELSKEERELLISSTCGPCFAELFADDGLEDVA
jgi:hypothetical protein